MKGVDINSVCCTCNDGDSGVVSGRDLMVADGDVEDKLSSSSSSPTTSCSSAL